MGQRLETEDQLTPEDEGWGRVFSDAWFDSAGGTECARERMGHLCELVAYTRIHPAEELAYPIERVWSFLTQHEREQLVTGVTPEGMPGDAAETFLEWRNQLRPSRRFEGWVRPSKKRRATG